MGHWNHRVVRRTVIEAGKLVQRFGVHECFYGNGVVGWAEDPVAIEGETIDELRETLERMLKALDDPVIEDDMIR